MSYTALRLKIGITTWSGSSKYASSCGHYYYWNIYALCNALSNSNFLPTFLQHGLGHHPLASKHHQQSCRVIRHGICVD